MHVPLTGSINPQTFESFNENHIFHQQAHQSRPMPWNQAQEQAQQIPLPHWPTCMSPSCHFMSCMDLIHACTPYSYSLPILFYFMFFWSCMSTSRTYILLLFSLQPFLRMEKIKIIIKHKSNRNGTRNVLRLSERWAHSWCRCLIWASPTVTKSVKIFKFWGLS